jgi:hypothetical protein
LTYLTSSFLLPPFVTSFFAEFFFISLHFSRHTCRSSKRGANGESSVVVIVAYSDGGSFFLFTTSDEVGKGKAQTDITQHKHARTYEALVFLFFSRFPFAHFLF